MRRLSMRNKRKSEATSEDESEENGVNNSGTTGKNNKNARRSIAKRRSAPRNTTDDNAEAKNLSTTSDEPEKERENGQKTVLNKKSSPNKRKKKEDKAASTSSRDKSSAEDDEYEVEKLVNSRTIKGRRQFLVRWKGYGESADTWENEKDLSCPALIQEYLDEEKDKETESSNTNLAKTSKTKKSKTTSKKETEKEEHNKEDKESGSSKEFEVEKVIEVHFKKNGTREFLIRWKGFSSAHDSWEPESNLNCPYLISRFMEKLEKVKTADMRELRTNRVHTKRYTLSTHDAGRRLSKRNRDKQRATYHECDE